MELLIVVALIMILSSVTVGSYLQATIRSKDTARKSDLNQIVKALESFNTDVGRYPLSVTNEDYIHCYNKVSGAVTNPACPGNKLYASIDGSRIDYMLIPTDPDPNQKYVYISDGSSFSIYSALENTSDKDLLKLDSGSVDLDPWDISCGDLKCNYKVTEVGLAKTK